MQKGLLIPSPKGGQQVNQALVDEQHIPNIHVDTEKGSKHRHPPGIVAQMGSVSSLQAEPDS